MLAFLADAANHGVGRNGLSIPVRNRKGMFSVVSFTSDRSKIEWERYKNENNLKLQLLAVLIGLAAGNRTSSSPRRLSSFRAARSNV